MGMGGRRQGQESYGEENRRAEEDRRRLEVNQRDRLKDGDAGWSGDRDVREGRRVDEGTGPWIGRQGRGKETETGAKGSKGEQGTGRVQGDKCKGKD